MVKTKEKNIENIQTCQKDSSGNCMSESKSICKQDKKQIYCKGGVLSSDVSKARKSGCPCMSSKEYSELPK